jgi:hypothetical protein
MATKKTSKDALCIISPRKDDPLNLRGMLYEQIAKLLQRMRKKASDEEISIAEEIRILSPVIGYVCKILNHNEDSENVGSAVRKYATAFTAHDSGRGAQGRRLAAVPDIDTSDEPEDGFEPDTAA